MFQALPLRVFGIMQNDTLLAIPFFTFMGIILERSGMAEDLLETVGQVFGPLRGGLAVAVILVGALLAATTGVVAAAVISMGLISLPIMLRYGYNRTIATGTITASGTLAQAIPPSLVLIVLADQLGRSVGDMYAGAMLPGLLLVGCYLPVRGRGGRREAQPGCRRCRPKPASTAKATAPAATVRCWCCSSSAVRPATCLVADARRMINSLTGRVTPAPGDETFIMSHDRGHLLALVLALVNKFLKLGLLSQAGRSRSPSC
jgi:H+/gluconate symporter-like permease